MGLLSAWVMAYLVLVYLETVLVSVQDRCMVWTKCTIGLEIILDEANGTPGDVAHVESYFGLFHDGVSVWAR
jgi:hypothetical protein